MWQVLLRLVRSKVFIQVLPSIMWWFIKNGRAIWQKTKALASKKLPMKVVIRNTRNGITVDVGGDTWVYCNTENNEMENWRDFLVDITQAYGPGEDSRYAESRLYVLIHPGDKHSDYCKPACPFCGHFCEENHSPSTSPELRH